MHAIGGNGRSTDPAFGVLAVSVLFDVFEKFQEVFGDRQVASRFHHVPDGLIQSRLLHLLADSVDRTRVPVRDDRRFVLVNGW